MTDERYQGDGIPTHQNHDLRDDEIDLFQLAETLWRQKVWIVAITVLAVAAASVYVLVLATPVYEVAIQVRPGDEEAGGWNADAVASWIKEGQYRFLLEKELENPEKPPRIQVRRNGDNPLVTLFVETPDPEKGQRVLSTLHKSWIDYYAKEGRDPRIKRITEQKETQLENLEEQLQTITSEKEKKREANEQALARMEQTKKTTMANTNKLIEQRNAILEDAEAQDLSLLLFTNIIQQNIYYASQLEEDIAEYRERLHELNLEIAEDRQKIKDQIATLRSELLSLTPVELISGPTATENPVRPRPMLILALALVAGGFLGVLIAFVRGAWLARKHGQF